LANQKAKNRSDREHVTPVIKYSKRFKKLNFKNNINLSKMNWTLDEYNDLNFIKNIFMKFKNIYFNTGDIIQLLEKNKRIKNLQNLKIRDEGYGMKIGQKLWRRAQSLIPGGNMLISKREERFLPNRWPNYFSKAKGCFVWGLDGKKYIDISLMGVGTNILGYANSKIDKEVNKNIMKSNMSTLNCPEEVYLIEELIKLHPWFQMGKSTRSGGEANAVAIRIARATQKKREKIAICGYHGWHDWYVAANLNGKENLDTHLLTGIEPLGVPRVLKNSTFTFDYNNFKQLKKLVNKNKDIGIIKMEVMRNIPPKNNFLKKVRKLADDKKIILIFDECTSGFRETNGGLHKKYNVKPDLAIFGKALGNGYPINVILGKEKVMKNASKTFISSTFWSDRIGPTAALKTLDEMKKIQSWKMITAKGKKVVKFWRKMSKKYKLGLQIYGLPSLCTFNFRSKDNQKIKTFITQEMLKRGYLASNSVYLSTSHTNKILKNYFINLEQVFKKCSFLLKNNKISKYLEGPVITAGFRRLN
ncbi:MAG: glutamate-1-semialdehyde aminotransferase, partial [Pelagibacteraceae bacterium TMED216]